MKPTPIIRRAATTAPIPLEEQIKRVAASPPQVFNKPIFFDQLVSTGSLLLDLAISGTVTKYGGIPGRIIVQVYGKNSTGKTTLAAEALGYAQRAGGEYEIKDGESRLVPSYCETFGVKLDQSKISRSGVISDIFESVIGPLETKQVGNKKVTARNTERAWKPDPSHINFLLVDSLASLASKMEMEQGDKMGQKRAKDFSEGFRQISEHIYKYNILMFCTDQVRANVDGGMYEPDTTTSGGYAIGYYASLSISLKKTGNLVKEISLVGKDKKEKHVYGIEILAKVEKSSCDKPYRIAPLRLIFNYGSDDIGANLSWLKDHGYFIDKYEKGTGYVVNNKYFAGLDGAIKEVEDQSLEQEIRDMVVELWNRIEEEVRPKRKEKVRL